MILYISWTRKKPKKYKFIPVPSNSPCSVPCGGGTQVITFKCFTDTEDTGLIPVADSICINWGLPKPPITNQPCNTQVC